MKNSKLIVGEILLIVVAIIILIFIMIKGSQKANIENHLVYEETFQDITDLSINLNSYDLKIYESEDENFKVEVYGKDKKAINVVTDNNSLNIKEKGNTFYFGIYFYSDEVHVYIPKNYQKDSSIKTVSGDITSNKLLKGSITSTSGDITLTSIANTFVKTLSGNIKITEMNSSKLKSTSGDIAVDSIENDTTIETTSGDVDIKKMTGIINLKTTSGDILISYLELLGDSKISARSGDIEISTLKNGYVSEDTKSGSASVKTERGDYKLDINTTSGDIYIR